jgi:hypothetical protein
MTLAIMQPYFLPYIGYYQLIKAVDKFVIYDDVNFINRGWINRNNILSGNAAMLFTIPLMGASQNRLIREIEIMEDNTWRKRLVKTVEQAYRKAPYFEETNALFNRILFADNQKIGALATVSIRSIADYLDMDTEFVTSSAIYANDHLKAQERILDICRKENADHYINPIGGMELYSRELFEAAGIKLNFIKSGPIAYRQFNDGFVPNLSILDVLMFNSKEQVKGMLDQYELI